MAFIKRQPLEGEKPSPYGRVYIFEFILEDGTEIYKVGMVNKDSMSRVTDRLLEVLRDFFMKYRYIPKSRIVKAKKCLIPYYVETHVHNLLADLKYTPDKKFDGSNELFYELDLDELVNYLEEFEYGELLRGETSMATDRYEKIQEAIRIDMEAKQRKNKAKGTDELPF